MSEHLDARIVPPARDRSPARAGIDPPYPQSSGAAIPIVGRLPASTEENGELENVLALLLGHLFVSAVAGRRINAYPRDALLEELSPLMRSRLVSWLISSRFLCRLGMHFWVCEVEFTDNAHRVMGWACGVCDRLR